MLPADNPRLAGMLPLWVWDSMRPLAQRRDAHKHAADWHFMSLIPNFHLCVLCNQGQGSGAGQHVSLEKYHQVSEATLHLLALYPHLMESDLLQYSKSYDVTSGCLIPSPSQLVRLHPLCLPSRYFSELEARSCKLQKYKYQVDIRKIFITMTVVQPWDKSPKRKGFEFSRLDQTEQPDIALKPVLI